MPWPDVHARRLGWGADMTVDGVWAPTAEDLVISGRGPHVQGGLFNFSRGGNQGGEGNDAAGEWFVEGLYEELDSPNEFFFDPATRTLSLLYNDSGTPPSEVVVPFLAQLLLLRGSQAYPVLNVSLQNLTFTATRPTFLDPRGNPSGGAAVEPQSKIHGGFVVAALTLPLLPLLLPLTQVIGRWNAWGPSFWRAPSTAASSVAIFPASTPTPCSFQGTTALPWCNATISSGSVKAPSPLGGAQTTTTAPTATNRVSRWWLKTSSVRLAISRNRAVSTVRGTRTGQEAQLGRIGECECV